MLGLKLLKLVFEVLNVLLFALTEGALRGSILGAATLSRVLAGVRRRGRSFKALTMRMLETLSVSCCVFDRLLRRSSIGGWVRSVNSMELTTCGGESMY